MFLYESIEQAKTFGAYRPLPVYIGQNINPNFELRPYQQAAFQNFITYFETPMLKKKPSQVLFHMATGSGKTLIMAGLMLYLYRQGYRDFLFFVNLSNIVKKTKDNFLNQASSKYLFAGEIILDGEKIPIKEVTNFQYSDPKAINLCFTTTQGLHANMWAARENDMTFEDFEGRKVVMISDEAHHLNASTKKMNKDEEESYHSWEDTVHQIFRRCQDNVLLEFTATCDLANALIKKAYEDKIVFDYPLKKFRDDRYSKEIVTLRTDLSVMERSLQALVLSQYRMKLFQDQRLSVKPVILFKAAKIADSKAFQAAFSETVRQLTGEELKRLSQLVSNETMERAYHYFKTHGISFEMLAQELREDFAPEHCVSVNDDKEAEKKQLLLNSLEDEDNPYRAIFEVKKLDEGWDVLNLFDIVRLYETRQSWGKTISPATVSEAQLIGRGARYCPFRLEEGQPLYQRKYDQDSGNELRMLEELYYHCQNDSRYIYELHRALKEMGLDQEEVVERRYEWKEAFKASAFYQKGLVFFNTRHLKFSEDKGLIPSMRNRVYRVMLSVGSSGEDLVLEEGGFQDDNSLLYPYRRSLGELAEENYAIVHKAMMRYPVFQFQNLKKHFPDLRSTREFIREERFLGKIGLEVKSNHKLLSEELKYRACLKVLGEIASGLAASLEVYEGTEEFEASPFQEVFQEKTVRYTAPHNGEEGISQNDLAVDKRFRLDLSKEDWYAFQDCFGTTEEKAFVAHFKDYVGQLKEEYEEVFLVRNERQLILYSFEEGRRFEPDFVLFLGRKGEKGYEYRQIFIEAKGGHLMLQDGWKEDFLLELEKRAVPVANLENGNTYRIEGFHFYNEERRSKEFQTDMEKLF